jgi:hypothetical protein
MASLFVAPLSAQQWEFDAAATPPSLAPVSNGSAHQPIGNRLQGGARVTIIESTSANAGHIQDSVWRSVAAAEGFAAGIYSQATLDTTAFFGTTDILVVSSGVIGLSSTAVSNIMAFLASGGSVYIQGEYLPTYGTNIAFRSIVAGSGGGFTIGSTVSGDLVPMAVSGELSTTPYTTGSLSYHWYGCNGTSGTGVTPFMHYNGSDFGWTYEYPSGGRLAHNTDQDWVRVRTNTNLVANILYWLCPTGIRLEAVNLVAGQATTLKASNATPGSPIFFAYSLLGGGPSNTQFGSALLSPPIRRLPPVVADASGNASYNRNLPVGTSGLNIWIQAYDFVGAQFSNGLAETIL